MIVVGRKFSTDLSDFSDFCRGWVFGVESMLVEQQPWNLAGVLPSGRI